MKLPMWILVLRLSFAAAFTGCSAEDGGEGASPSADAAANDSATADAGVEVTPSDVVAAADTPDAGPAPCDDGDKAKCDDNNACTADACDGKIGACKSNAMVGCKLCKMASECDDKDACTKDACGAGKCDNSKIAACLGATDFEMVSAVQTQATFPAPGPVSVTYIFKNTGQPALMSCPPASRTAPNETGNSSAAGECRPPAANGGEALG